MLRRKLLRDLRAQKGQALAVVALIAMGVMLFVASYAGYRDLRDSYAATRTSLRLAPISVVLSQLGAVDVARITALPEVERAEGRVVLDRPARIANGHFLDGSSGELRLTGRLISLPDTGAPEFDVPSLVEGALPANDTSVLIEQHLARQHELHAGSTVELDVDGLKTFTVSGVAVSAEYLWVSRDAQDLMPAPDEFGVLWLRRGALTPIAPEGTVNELLYAPKAGVSAIDAVSRTLGADRVLSQTRAEDLPGVRLMQLDVDGLKEMAFFFPLFFLGVATFVALALLSRLVETQRPIIGTLSALGVPRGRILRHHLAWAALLAIAGAVLGIITGALGGVGMARGYADELGIPTVVTSLHPDLWAVGLLMALGSATFAGLFPAWRATRIAPVEAIRAERPQRTGLFRLAPRAGPLSLRLGMRALLVHPGRSFGTALSVAAALLVTIITASMGDSMQVGLQTELELAHRFDVRADFLLPRPISELIAETKALTGVREVEAIITLPARVAANGASKDVLLEGLPADSALDRPINAAGSTVLPQPGQLILPRELAKTLNVHPGDEITLTPAGASATTLRVGALADPLMGQSVAMNRAELQKLLGLGDDANTVLTTTAPGKARAVRAALASWPGAARVQDAASFKSQINQMLGLMDFFIGVMVLLGGLLAATVLYAVATLSVLERTRELATLRAMGCPRSTVVRTITFGNLVLALTGLALGIGPSLWAVPRVMALFNSELFSLPAVVGTRTWVAALGGCVVIVLIAQWPSIRAVLRLDLATAVRGREG